MKRIVEETKENGETQYRVEVKSLFTFGRWVTDIHYDPIHHCWFDAVYSTLREAKEYSDIPSIKTGIVKREIVETF